MGKLSNYLKSLRSFLNTPEVEDEDKIDIKNFDNVDPSIIAALNSQSQKMDDKAKSMFEEDKKDMKKKMSQGVKISKPQNVRRVEREERAQEEREM